MWEIPVNCEGPRLRDWAWLMTVSLIIELLSVDVFGSVLISEVPKFVLVPDETFSRRVLHVYKWFRRVCNNGSCVGI